MQHWRRVVCLHSSAWCKAAKSKCYNTAVQWLVLDAALPIARVTRWSHQVFGDRDSGGILLGVPQQLHPGLDQIGGVDEDPRRHAAGTGDYEVGIRRQVLGSGL